MISTKNSALANNENFETSEYAAGNQDLGSFGPLERFIHDDKVPTYFIKEPKGCAPFAKIDSEMTQIAGIVQYGSSFEATIPRKGDYLLKVYIDLGLSDVELSEQNQYGDDGVIGYVQNLGHNIFKKVSLIINDTEVCTLDSKYLDAELEFYVNNNKQDGYKSIIGGDRKPCTVSRDRFIDQKDLYVLLPFYFSKDSGNALPIATLTKSDIKIKFELRNWEELLILESKSKLGCSVVSPRPTDLKHEPHITHFHIRTEYSLVSRKERSRIGCMERYMLIEQPTTHLHEISLDMQNDANEIIIPFKAPIGAMKSCFFSIVNMSHPNMHSNYGIGCPETSGPLRIPEGSHGTGIEYASLYYDDIERVPQSRSQFFTHYQPYCYAVRIPDQPVGIHMYSFALNPHSSDPTGTTNPEATGKEIRFKIKLSAAMRDAMLQTDCGNHPQKFAFSLITINYRLARIVNGRFELLRNDGSFRSNFQS